MTGWSISATLLLGIAAGPYGLHMLSPTVLSLLDPGIAMGFGDARRVRWTQLQSAAAADGRISCRIAPTDGAGRYRRR